MSDEDRNAAMELAIEEMNSKFNRTVAKLDSMWGRGQKETTREQNALVFARALARCGGTFEFTPAHRDFGYETIWQAMAGEMHDPSAKPKQRGENGDKYASQYKFGCVAFNDKMVEEWDNQVIYSVPRTVNGGRIEVITVKGDFVVNADNQTAHEVWAGRGANRVEGQITSVMVKLARATSVEKACNTLVSVLENSIQKLPSMAHQGSREQRESA